MSRRVIEMLCLIAACAGSCLAAQTLYPHASSNALPVAPPTFGPSTPDTNYVDAAAPITVALHPTAIAPPRASGGVEIKGRGVRLHVSRLRPGHYELELLRHSEAAPELLGTLNIIDPTLGPDRQATDDTKEASANPESVLLQTDAQMQLPANVVVGDASRVLLLGPGGNAVLVGEVKQRPLQK